MPIMLGIKKVLIVFLVMISGVSYGDASLTSLTPDAHNLADWVIESDDNQNRPFIIIDKKESKVFVFLKDGKLYGESSALIGITIGDINAPGVGMKKIADITIEERTTPAGRFEAALGPSLNKTELLWIDYDSGISMHTVITSNPSEHRLQRLLSQKSAEHRITYGCVNVSSIFYKEVIRPTFRNTGGIVYILPEIQSILTVFGSEADRFSRRTIH